MKAIYPCVHSVRSESVALCHNVRSDSVALSVQGQNGWFSVQQKVS